MGKGRRNAMLSEGWWGENTSVGMGVDFTPWDGAAGKAVVCTSSPWRTVIYYRISKDSFPDVSGPLDTSMIVSTGVFFSPRDLSFFLPRTLIFLGLHAP